jgi:hypothetical protein
MAFEQLISKDMEETLSESIKFGISSLFLVFLGLVLYILVKAPPLHHYNH